MNAKPQTQDVGQSNVGFASTLTTLHTIYVRIHLLICYIYIYIIAKPETPHIVETYPRKSEKIGLRQLDCNVDERLPDSTTKVNRWDETTHSVQQELPQGIRTYMHVHTRIHTSICT